MIVLDEQLLGRQLELELSRWYRGPVLFITDLRPGTVIKDEAIPLILRRQGTPTFVTINESDFWRKVAIDRHFCVICFALPDSQVSAIPGLLRKVMQHTLFRTKSARMGKVLRITHEVVAYYAHHDLHVRVVSLE